MADGLTILENLAPITKENAGKRESGSESWLPSNWESSIPILRTVFFFFGGWGGVGRGLLVSWEQKYMKMQNFPRH